MTTFRYTAMATTILAGLAIFACDAQAKGPSISVGGISNFSSMRVDFNRVGGPNRALSRDDLRTVPIDVAKSDKGGTKKDTAKKDAAKKGVSTNRVSNPKATGGGRGKEDVAPATARIPAHLEEIFHLTNGNLDDLSQLAQLGDWIRNGPRTAPNPFGTPNADPFALPEELGGGKPGGDGDRDRNFLDGWLGYSNAPGGPDTSKSGWAGIWTVVPGSQRQGDGYRETSYYDSETGRHGTVKVYWDGNGNSRREITVGGWEATTDNQWTVQTTHEDSNGSHRRTTDTTDVVYGVRQRDMAVFTTHTVETTGEGPTSQAAHEEPRYQEPGPKDDQPVAEGTGRPGRTGWCSPTGGCVTGSVVQGPRINPVADNSMPEMRSQLPSWATDPCPDCTARGGGRYTGYDPRNEGAGDEGGRGGRNPI